MPDCDSDHVNTVGEPDEGKLHVRFDEGRLVRPAPNQSPTLPVSVISQARPKRNSGGRL